MHECAGAYVPESTGANEGQRGASDSLELDFQIHVIRVLGTELCPSTRPANVRNFYAVSLASS